MAQQNNEFEIATMKKTVTILMATYNGEKFLVEQLDSIINQTYQEWRLIIRDDLSIDKTPSIIKKYCESDSRIQLLNSSERLGALGNFSTLLEYAKESDYIMFCDQDDVWHDKKIEKSIFEIKKCEGQYTQNHPLLLYTDKEWVDKNLQRMERREKNYNDEISSLLSQNHIYGCTMIINQALVKNVLPIPSYAQNHDYWIALNAAVNGTIQKINYVGIYYRQHDRNVTGGENNASIKFKLRSWAKINRLMLEVIEQNILFCQSHSMKNSETLKKYINIFNSNKFLRVLRAKTFGLHTDSLLGTLRLYYIIFSYKQLDK